MQTLLSEHVKVDSTSDIILTTAESNSAEWMIWASGARNFFIERYDPKMLSRISLLS
jgi:hypothetical protein